MKVLLLIDSLGSGGAQRQLCLLARELKRAGWNVELLVYHSALDHFGPLLAAAEIPVIRLQKQTRFSLRTPVAIAWHALTGGYQAMLAFLPTPTVYGAIARAAGGPPLLVSERFSFQGSKPDRASWVVAQFQRLAAVVVCNSRHHGARFTAAFPWLRSRTCVVYNGAELTPAQPLTTGARPLRLLAIGTVTPRKNFATVIEALGCLRAHGLPVPQVRWAGKVGLEPAERAARAQAERRLVELDLASHWEWLGERTDIPTLLGECDALIHASFLEGFPNAMGEAFAAGRPVLASAVGDHALLVREGENGFLFDPAAAESIAAAMVRAQQLERGALQEMGRRARAVAETQLSVSAMTRHYARLLRAAGGTEEAVL
ncbi:glycosyltransferase [Horticoccus sp. 23ND18S-11]|uniref:glycosyltransferase n=1 Tax=Horticoccus sp. 23ND18S-11 TaxID=3391832 RepID=UPI0039C95BC1